MPGSVGPRSKGSRPKVKELGPTKKACLAQPTQISATFTSSLLPSLPSVQKSVPCLPVLRREYPHPPPNPACSQCSSLFPRLAPVRIPWCRRRRAVFIRGQSSTIAFFRPPELDQTSTSFPPSEKNLPSP